MQEQENLSRLFQEKPPHWGLRGDPSLWQEMSDVLGDRAYPNTEEEFAVLIEQTYEQLTGVPLTQRDYLYVERYDHGGMSSGQIAPSFWIEKGIPLLRARYRETKLRPDTKFARRSGPLTNRASRPVCAGVTVLGFRRNLEELEDEFCKNAEHSFASSLEDRQVDASELTDDQWEAGVNERYNNEPQSDLQVLLSRRKGCTWSAPKQDLLDGALFFYLGKRALANVRRCVRQARNEDKVDDTPFMRSLL